jgi:antitoxin (DNA-binding transcriptional repressor) of toxin-antitoxin stability system
LGASGTARNYVDKVATGGYHDSMESKAVGIKQLRDSLSRYVKEARNGTRILILDREEVVAEIREPQANYAPAHREGRAEQMAREGALIRPARKKEPLGPSPLHLPSGTSQALLREDRGET